MPETTVAVTNPEPSNRPLVVTGTLTTTPSGTQDVNVVSPNPLPTSPTGTQNVSITSQPIQTTAVKDPSIDGVYVFSADEITGVAAATNYLSIFNPVGSGKTVIFAGAFISCVTAGGSSITAPMRGYRATAISGGVLQADSASAKFISANPDPVAEIRTGNPAATLDGALFNSPPPLSSTQGGTPVHAVPVPGGTGPFTLVEGEGIVLRQTTGDTDLRWNLSIVWAEA